MSYYPYIMLIVLLIQHVPLNASVDFCVQTGTIKRSDSRVRTGVSNVMSDVISEGNQNRLGYSGFIQSALD
jgi:hypothetical protein